MSKYRIFNTTSGHCLGVYEGEDEKDVLDAMARDAGCRDFEHSCEVTESDGSDVVAEEVEQS